ncbi:MAG TPA: carboxypeptidase-like regulatory domain-containing protein [Bryobacteraceae bacterium]|nr:carboxypeptidase-like regulatory domain-containing protein [Bryobacteraceae bacterium]
MATGSILGAVTDSSGASIASATVTVTNKATGVPRPLATNAQGLYNAPALPAGDYEVRIEMLGFKTEVRNAQVLAGTDTTVNVALTLGETREVVTVDAVAAQVNYENHTVAGVIERKTIQDLPLNGRNALQLASLEPGVTVGPGSQSNFNSMQYITVNGTYDGLGPRLTLDGAVINDEVEGGNSMNFSQEIVQEFQLAQLNYDVSTGVGASGSVNIVTRSGSNDFHGSAFYYYRDHNMAAYPALKRIALALDPFFQRKNPGFWVGGPVIKNKLFFFGSYEHLSQTSAIADVNDLASLQPLNGVYPSPLHYNWVNARFDYHLNDKENMFFRYTHDGNKDLGPYSGTGNPSAWVQNSNWSDQFIAGLTSVITPNIVNDLRAQFHYWQNNAPAAPASACVAPCFGAGLPAVTGVIGSSYIYGVGNYPNGPQFHQSKSGEIIEALEWQKGKHRIRGGVDFERSYTRYKPWNNCFPACISVVAPEFVPLLGGAAFPAGSFANVASSVNSTAALLSLPIFGLNPIESYAGIGIGNGTWPGIYEPNVGEYNNRIHPWVADTWKARPNLTLNFGLGYNIETGLFPSNIPLPQYLAPILEGQTGGVPYGLGAPQSNKKNFAPMIGFAWALGKDRKTVIRGGGGMYWDTVPVWYQFKSTAAAGPAGDGRVTVAVNAFTNIFPNMYQQTATGVQPLPIGAPIPTNTLSTITLGQFIQILNQQVPVLQANIFGNTPTKGPYSVTSIQLLKSGVDIFPSKYPEPRTYQTSIGVQRELPWGMVLSADWVRRQGENESFGALDLNHSSVIGGPVIPRCATTPDFNPNDECSIGPISFWVPEGHSRFNGLLVKTQKRLSNRVQFTVSYALQKLTYESASVNLQNYNSTYGPILAKQNLNIAGTINLPWRFTLSLNSSVIAPTPVEPTISGIDLNGSGNTTFPISLAVPGVPYKCFLYSCGNSDLAKAVDTFNSTQAGKIALNGVKVPALKLPASYHMGAPIVNQDIRVTKILTYKERYNLNVFGEVFNVFNIGNLTYGNLGLTSPQFGLPTARVGQGYTFASGGPRALQVGARFIF